MIVFDSIARSNLPTSSKTTLRSMLDKLTGGEMSQYATGHGLARRFVFPQHGAVREGLESTAVGGILGAIHSARSGGLDVKVGSASVPVDAAVGALGLIAATVWPDSKAAQDARLVGNVGLGIYGFRTGASLTTKFGFGATTPTTKVAGEEEDPIARAASKL